MEAKSLNEDGEDEGGKPKSQTSPERPVVEPRVEREEKQTGTQAREDKESMTEKRRAPSTLADWSQVAIQGVLLIGALYALSIYRGQLIEMQKANVLMKASTDAATQAAQAAKDSIDQIERNAHFDQRAWVAQSEIAGKPELDKAYRIAVRIKNTGKTFAKRYTSVTAARVKQLSDPDPDFEKIVREEYKDATTVGIIPPNGTTMQVLEINKGAKMTQENLDELKTPTVVVLVFGKLTYWDIFNCEHWTTFCCRAYTDGTFETYGSYNDADENYCP